MAEIKIRELSIGDWVMNLYANKPSRVIGLRPMFQDTYEIITVSDGTQYMLIEDKELHNYEPIPLTPEILEKNGFRQLNRFNEYVIGEWDSNPFIAVQLAEKFVEPTILVKNGGTCAHLFGSRGECVHQLQHALRVAGVEKEIGL